MKKLFLVATAAIMLINSGKSQINMNSTGNVDISGIISTTKASGESSNYSIVNGNLGVGPFWGGQPRKLFDVNGYSYFSCIPASSGFYFESLNTYPIILPQWPGNLYLGKYGSELRYIYTRYLYTSNGEVYSYSDSTIKENIKPYEGALQKILKLHTVKFDYKESLNDSVRVEEDRKKFNQEGKDKVGYIAQQLKEVIPECVKYDEDAKLYAISKTTLIPYLAQAIKEQQAMIESLQSEIQELKKNAGNGGSLKNATVTSEKTSIQAGTINALYQNAPNPFSQSTTIEYSIAENVQKAMICIYDMNGTQLKCIPLHLTGYGNITINGSELHSGMYMYSLIADGQLIDTKRMILTD